MLFHYLLIDLCEISVYLYHSYLAASPVQMPQYVQIYQALGSGLHITNLVLYAYLSM